MARTPVYRSKLWNNSVCKRAVSPRANQSSVLSGAPADVRNWLTYGVRGCPSVQVGTRTGWQHGRDVNVIRHARCTACMQLFELYLKHNAHRYHEI